MKTATGKLLLVGTFLTCCKYSFAVQYEVERHEILTKSALNKELVKLYFVDADSYDKTELYGPNTDKNKTLEKKQRLKDEFTEEVAEILDEKRVIVNNWGLTVMTKVILKGVIVTAQFDSYMDEKRMAIKPDIACYSNGPKSSMPLYYWTWILNLAFAQIPDVDESHRSLCAQLEFDESSVIKDASDFMCDLSKFVGVTDMFRIKIFIEQKPKILCMRKKDNEKVIMVPLSPIMDGNKAHFLCIHSSESEKFSLEIVTTIIKRKFGEFLASTSHSYF